MKKLLKTLFFTYLALMILIVMPVKLYADDASQLINLGMQPELAKKLVQVVNTLASPFTNNTWVTVRNAANSANINTLKVDASDDTWLNADTGDVIKFGVAGTAEATLDNDQLTFSGASFEFVPGATSLLFRNNADDNTNLGITDAGVVTARAGLVATAGGVTATAGNLVATAGSLVISDATKGLTMTPGTVAAAGSVQGDAAAILNRVEVVTAADATKGVILPATPTAGDFYIIVNSAAAVLKIYPGSGDAINASGANTAVSVAASLPIFCVATSASQWWCGEPAAP